MDILPQALDPIRKIELWKKARKEPLTLNERHEIIVGHIRLAFKMAHKITKLKPYKSDLFISESLFALVAATENDKIQDNSQKYEDVTTYIGGFIRIRLLDAYNDDFISKNVVAKRKARGQKIPEFQMQYPELVKMDNDLELFEIHDLLNNLLRTKKEFQIIDLRLDGYTDDEIANMLNCHRATVYETRMEIGKRFNLLMK